MGGDPILFQHLFWFYSHPAVYIMILPSMGIISELISSFSRKEDFWLRIYRFFKYRDRGLWLSRLGTPFMFVSGQSIYAGYVFSFLTMVVAVPSAIKVFNWSATTVYKGSMFL